MTPFGLMTGPAFGGFGLMQQDPLDKKEAFRQALLQAGLGIMSARTGGNLTAAIGQGGMQGLQAYQQNLAEQKAGQRQAGMDAMEQARFGMQQKRFEAEQEDTAEQKARQKAFEEAVKGAYQLDEMGNVIGIDKNKYQAALTMLDPSQAAKMFYQGQQEAQPYYQQAVDAQRGLGSFNARTGEFVFPGGLVRPSDDPGTRGKIVAAETGAKAVTEAVTDAQLGLGQAQEKATQSVALIDAALSHPGRKTATGASGKLDPRNYVPGTDAYDFAVLSEQIKGKAFLEAFQSLKGAGAITDREGAAATAAMARLNTAQSDKAYEEALKELKGIIQRGLDRQRSRAIGPDAPLNLQLQGMPQPQQGAGWGIKKIP
jgi:hypothetical protein